MTFAARQITMTFNYGTGLDGNAPGTGSEVKLANLRCAARITVAGGLSQGELNLRIYGMTLSLMNQLSTLNVPLAVVRNNKILIEAGDASVGLAQIYEGTISSAWADMDSSPEVAFNVVAYAGLYEAMVPAPAASFQGAADAATIMAAIAKTAGLNFENDGVSGIMLSNRYFPGTPRMQAQACAAAANIEWIIDNGTLAIWPRSGNRSGQTVAISAETGMVGYPSYTANGLMVRAIFNPNLRYGSLVSVSSSAIPTSSGQAANATGKQRLPVDGQWKVSSLSHDIAAQLPGGPWFTELQLVPPSVVIVSR